VAEFVVFGPLDETDLYHDLGTDPVGAQAITNFASREANCFRKRRLINLDPIELRA
jgi:hypothetical protein